MDGDLTEVTANHSGIEGWAGLVSGTGNHGFDPEFEDPLGVDMIAGTLDDDYRLKATSPYRDAGSNALLGLDSFDLDADGDLLELLPLDLDGLPRQFDNAYRLDGMQGNTPAVDLGAYETPLGTPACSSDRYCVGGANSVGPGSSIYLHRVTEPGTGSTDAAGGRMSSEQGWPVPLRSQLGTNPLRRRISVYRGSAVQTPPPNRLEFSRGVCPGDRLQRPPHR